jgi:hypothetical protein
MHTLIYAPADAPSAEQIAAALRQARVDVIDLTESAAPALDHPAQSALIAVIGAHPDDPALISAITAALDRGQHIIPVQLARAALPKLIDHIVPLDFSESVDLPALRARLDEVESGAAGIPMRVRTPTVKRANRRAGWFLAALAVGMFAVGIYGVGVLGIQAPRREYDQVNTEVALTTAPIIAAELAEYARLLPRDGASAVGFESTLRAVPTAYRAFLAGTATAVHQGTPLITPTPTSASTEANRGGS